MLDGLPSRVERYMDVVSARQKLVARNIANADTPGYKTQDIDFASELQRVAGGSGSPSIVDAQGLVTRNDGNNVSLDREARMLAENTLRFNIATQLLRGQIRHIRAAINEGKSQ
jgi:flagellar basal-body rod protein FlgB